jgi:CheY-like chemotaxis protein
MSLNRRILVIDDNRAIHDDFRKILGPLPDVNQALRAMEDELFGETPPPTEAESVEIISAFQGREALGLVEQSESAGTPFSIAFLDVRMPPGWDGVETAGHLWRASPRLQIVICTAYSDYSWEEIVERLGPTTQLHLLRKPFDPVEVQKLATSLTEAWAAR